MARTCSRLRCSDTMLPSLSAFWLGPLWAHFKVVYNSCALH